MDAMDGPQDSNLLQHHHHHKKHITKPLKSAKGFSLMQKTMDKINDEDSNDE